MVARKENWPEMSRFVIITGEMTPGNPISTLNQAAPTGDSESEISNQLLSLTTNAVTFSLINVYDMTQLENH